MNTFKIEVGIPVYHALDTLNQTLESLFNQTTNDFSICLSFDGEACYNTPYEEIINNFAARGLNIRILLNSPHGGPGMAREAIIQTTESQYITFLDADDIFMPRAVELFTKLMDHYDCDIVRTSYITEQYGDFGTVIPQDSSSITHFHGKAYKVSYLLEKDIHFHPALTLNEDSYFNLVAWNGTLNRMEYAEPTYVWRNNLNSLTRYEGEKKFFERSYENYILSQVEALRKLFCLRDDLSDDLITATLILIYNNYMRAKAYDLPLEKCEEYINLLRDEQRIQLHLATYSNWVALVKNLRQAAIHEDRVIFYKEPFNDWAVRLLKGELKGNAD